MTPERRPVLVVEDHPADALLLRRAFQRTGFKNPIYEVRSGEHVLAYLEGELQYANRAKYPFPYLLILDSNMPGMTGWEVLTWIRQRPGFSNLIVILFGGSQSPEEVKKARELGANSYHAKPVDVAEFDKLVKRIAEFWLIGGAIG